MSTAESKVLTPIDDWPLAAADGDRPVFIVGMNGSGTTMLLDCLGRHPELYGFPRETRVLPEIVHTAWGDLDNDENYSKLWEAVRSIVWFAAINDNKKPPRPDNYLSNPRTVAAVIDAHYAYFAARHGKRRWLEKTPQHAQHVASLARVFTRAKFIHIIRDGRDCAASFERRWGRTPALTIHRWKSVIQLCQKDGAKLGDNRYFELKYEDLTADPERWMRAICAFLEVEFDPVVLVSEMPQTETEGVKGTIVRREPRYKKSFSPHRLRRLHAIAGSLLNELGYDDVEPLGEETPSSWRLWLWRGTDYARQYGTEITTKLKGKNHKSWRTIARLPLTAASQNRQQRF